MKRITVLALLVFPGVSGAAQSLTQAEACKLFSPSIVSIKTARDSGTGFIVSEDGWILTAKHVVIDPKMGVPDVTIGVTLPNGQLAFAKLIQNPDRLSQPQDFAILKVEATKLIPLKMGGEGDTAPGESLALIGFPFSAIGGTNKFCLSAIAATPQIPAGGGQNVIFFQGPSVKGVSGSPLISLRTGKVVGIVIIKLTGIDQGLDQARENLGSATVRIATPNGPVSINSAMGSIIDTLDNQLANGLGAALAISDAEYATGKAQKQYGLKK